MPPPLTHITMLCAGIGVAIVTAVIVPIALLLQGKGIPQFHVRVVCLPGLLSGFFWNIGSSSTCACSHCFHCALTSPFCRLAANISSIIASLSSLGQTAGYPLTQVLHVASLYIASEYLTSTLHLNACVMASRLSHACLDLPPAVSLPSGWFD